MIIMGTASQNMGDYESDRRLLTPADLLELKLFSFEEDARNQFFSEIVNPLNARVKRMHQRARRMADKKAPPLRKGVSYSKAQKADRSIKWAAEYRRHGRRLYKKMTFIERHLVKEFFSNVWGVVWEEHNPRQ